jgi:protein-disulfide isomerase
VDARVTVEVWSDFQCPFCARGAERLTQLREKYGEQVRVVFRHQPLPFHQHARLAAAAAMAAHEQGRFWEFHDALFAQQQALDRGSLEALAGKLGLDVHRFRQALDSGAYDNYLDAEGVEAQRRGIAGTPTFFINGTPVVGAQPLEAFVKVIDAELQR